MVLVTGNKGYIGHVMTKMLNDQSHKVVGLDSIYFDDCQLFQPNSLPFRQITKDIRDITEADMDGISSVIHLAGLSNDPLGEMSPLLTHDINARATVKLASLARKLSIQRFIFASSCSSYGIGVGDVPMTESAVLNPLTAYAKAKVEAEKGILKLADDNFHPVIMRNATVYGVSPLIRLDLVVNDLVANAHLTGNVSIMSDGMPWRPLIHIQDFCSAFLAALEAPVAVIHKQVFNVGINEENYQVKTIGRKVEELIPNSKMYILNKTGSDERTYRVDFCKIGKTLPKFNPSWNLSRGIEELYNAYKLYGLTSEQYNSAKYHRVRWMRQLIDRSKVDGDLRLI